MRQVINSLNAKTTTTTKPIEADTIIALPSLLQTGETEI